MTNKKIVQEGIVTPQIDLGDQSASSTIVYTSNDDTVTVNSNLTIVGDFTVNNTNNVSISDNIITLNDGELGAGVGGGGGISGLEIDRGSLDNARMYFDEAAIEWRFAQVDATNTVIATSATPVNADHLTNKLYVDTEITNAIGTVDELSEMADVDITDVPGGMPPAWVMPSGGWDGYSLAYDDASGKWMARLIPPGIAYLTVNSTDLLVGDGSAFPNDNDLNGIMQNGGTAYTIDLVDTGPGAGSYISPDITIDAQGRVTAASEGDIFQTITADVGGPYNANGVDFFKISGGSGMTASLAGNTTTIILNNTAVSPGGLFTLPTITVDPQGRITSAANGSIDVFKFVNADLGNNPTADGPSDTLNILGGTGIYTSGDVGTDTIAVHLDNTTVSAGSYTAADITINAQGQITSASNGLISTGEIAGSAVTGPKIAANAVDVSKIAHAGANLTLNTTGGGVPVWESQPTPSGYTFVGSLFVPIIPVSINESFSRFYTGINVGGNSLQWHDRYLIRVTCQWYTFWVGNAAEGVEIQWDKQQKFFFAGVNGGVITPPRTVANELSWTWSVNNVSGVGFNTIPEINQATIQLYKPVI